MPFLSIVSISLSSWAFSVSEYPMLSGLEKGVLSMSLITAPCWIVLKIKGSEVNFSQLLKYLPIWPPLKDWTSPFKNWGLTSRAELDSCSCNSNMAASASKYKSLLSGGSSPSGAAADCDRPISLMLEVSWSPAPPCPSVFVASFWETFSLWAW